MHFRRPALRPTDPSKLRQLNSDFDQIKNLKYGSFLIYQKYDQGLFGPVAPEVTAFILAGSGMTSFGLHIHPLHSRSGGDPTACALRHSHRLNNP